MAKLGEISVAIVADTKKFNDGINRSRKGLDDLAGSASKSLGKLTKLFAAATAGAGALGALGWGVKLASEAETANVAFRVLLGSQEKATKLIGEIKTLAASTPLGTAELLDASRKLASFGEDANTIPDTLRRIGDVSAAIGAPIGEIAELYGKARVQGRLFGEDINQLTGRGIPIIGELAKQFGVAESEVKKLVETGQVNFGNLEQAFISMTSKGGMFSGMLNEQSKTLAGQWSTLKDQIADIALTLGNAMLPLIKDIVAEVQKMAGPLKEAAETTALLAQATFNPTGTKERLKAHTRGLAKAGPNIERLTKESLAEGTRLKTMESLSTLTPFAKEMGSGLRDLGSVIGKDLRTIGGDIGGRVRGATSAAAGAVEGPVSRLPGFMAGIGPGLSRAVNDRFNPVEALAGEMKLGKAREAVQDFLKANPNLLGGGISSGGATNSAVLKGSERAQRLINQQRVRMLGGDKDKVQKDQLEVLKQLLAAAKQQVDGGQVVNIQ